MFVENKNKKAELVQKMNAEEGEVKDASGGGGGSRSDVQYLSILNARKNPDMLVPGGMFLKGNHYFKGDDNKVVPSGEESEKEEGAADEEAEFNKMMHQQ